MNSNRKTYTCFTSLALKNHSLSEKSGRKNIVAAAEPLQGVSEMVVQGRQRISDVCGLRMLLTPHLEVEEAASHLGQV